MGEADEGPKRVFGLAVFDLTRCLFFSLDPDSDPLCMLLLIDFLTLRSREYQALLHLYQDWEVHFRYMQACKYYLLLLMCVIWFISALQDYRNLSQLPNFSFSAALCHFCLSQQEGEDHEERNRHRLIADQMLQNTLIMFPGGLCESNSDMKVHCGYPSVTSSYSSDITVASFNCKCSF